jgi:peptide/nickel transport system substrate-binding protein
VTGDGAFASIPRRCTTYIGSPAAATNKEVDVRRRIVTGALTALALVLASCGDDNGESGSAGSRGDTAVTSESQPAADTSTPSESSSPVDTGGGSTPSTDDLGGDDVEFDPSGVFRFADSLPISFLDPHKATGGGFNVWLFPVYDRLFHITPDGDLIPGLATDWSYSEDGTVLSLTLREGVQFHDGTPFDADAVKANLDRGRTADESAVKSTLAVISEVRVVDPTHVELILTRPDGTLPYVLSERAGAIASPAAFERLELEPVGTGMYRVTAFQPETSATYVRNEDYWDPDAAGAARMEFQTILDNAQRANALISGQIDATMIDATEVQRVRDAGLNVDSSTNYQFFHLQLNRSRPGLDDTRVRQALNHAIDREGIVSALLNGLGEPGQQPFPPGTAGYSDELGESRYPYDPDKARQLLAEAGATDLSFEIMTLNIPLYAQVSEAVQAQLAEVGVTTTIQQVPSVSQTFYADQVGDSAIVPAFGALDPALLAQTLFSDQSFSNPGRHSTPEVMALIQQALTTTDPDERAPILKDLTTAITEEALDVVLYFPHTNLAYSDDVVGYQNWISARLEFRGVGMRAD